MHIYRCIYSLIQFQAGSDSKLLMQEENEFNVCLFKFCPIECLVCIYIYIYMPVDGLYSSISQEERLFELLFQMNAKVIIQRAQDVSIHSITIPSAHKTRSLPEFHWGWTWSWSILLQVQTGSGRIYLYGWQILCLNVLPRLKYSAPCAQCTICPSALESGSTLTLSCSVTCWGHQLEKWFFLNM